MKNQVLHRYFFIHQPFSLFFILICLCLEIRKEKAIVPPMIIPMSRVRNITIARDASNFQKMKEIATGAAFCTENAVTSERAIIIKINTVIHASFYFQLTRDCFLPI